MFPLSLTLALAVSVLAVALGAAARSGRVGVAARRPAPVSLAAAVDEVADIVPVAVVASGWSQALALAGGAANVYAPLVLAGISRSAGMSASSSSSSATTSSETSSCSSSSPRRPSFVPYLPIRRPINRLNRPCTVARIAEPLSEWKRRFGRQSVRRGLRDDYVSCLAWGA